MGEERLPAATGLPSQTSVPYEISAPDPAAAFCYMDMDGDSHGGGFIAMLFLVLSTNVKYPSDVFGVMDGG